MALVVDVDRRDEVDRRGEPRIDPVAECVHLGRLRVADDDQRLSLVRDEIIRGGLDKAACVFGQFARLDLGAEPARNMKRDIAHERGMQRQPLVRIGAGQPPHRLDRVEPQERLGRRLRLPHFRKGGGVSYLMRAGAERVGIEREHDPGTVDVRQHIVWLAERQCRAGARRVVVDRLVAQPARFGKDAAERAQLPDQRRRGNAAGDDAQARAVPRLLSGQLRRQRGFEFAPGGNVVAVPHRLRAIRRIERHDLGLRKNIDRAAARRMFRIAVEAGRPAVVRCRQHALRIAGQGDGSGELQRQARSDALRHGDVRDDLLRRRAA